MKALITGITGQMGSHFSELLLQEGHEVHGIVRRVALEAPEQRLWRLRNNLGLLHLHPGSLESYASILSVVDKVQPEILVHLAAQSYVSESFEDAFSTFNTNVNGTLHVLSALKERSRNTRFYFAATSEMFGRAPAPQNEETRFHPRSPYGISKVAGFELTRNFRESYGMFACSGILFNNEGPRRGFEFVTRKITASVARIACGSKEVLKLGNLDAQRDWGFVGDYAVAIYRMLQQSEPEDFVIATGKAHTVREFLDRAFRRAGLDWHDHVEIDSQLVRPAEVDLLCGDASKAREKLGWTPTVGFEDLVDMMVDADLEAERKKTDRDLRQAARDVLDPSKSLATARAKLRRLLDS